MANQNLEKALSFQLAELKKYIGFSYQELMKLEGTRIEIPSPDDLKDYDFARTVTKDEFGGLEVSVFHYYYPEDIEYPDYLKELMEDNDIKMGECKMNQWFNISEKGKITWPDLEHKDGED